MDKKRLLQPEIQSFIKEHEEEDLPHLMLQKKKYAHLPLHDIIEQLSARKKAKKKLPTWYKTAGILYPPTTAKYKAGLFSGNSALDLTGGFGVDSFYLAQRFNNLLYVEANKDLAQIAQHNFTCLQQQNIKTNALSAESFLAKNIQLFDLIYIDPDRRPKEKRVRGFLESKPNLPGLLPELYKIATNIMVKASPMMDITIGLKELGKVKMVIILAVDNEVKELLFWLTPQITSPTIRCINIDKQGDWVLEYVAAEERQESCEFGIVSQYLYEPNVAILKAGAFNILCKKFKLKKLHPNTHLYTSSVLVKDFPGRKFIVIGEEAYNKRKIEPLLKSSKANISVRNFPDTPAQVKKKLALRDGGKQYLFGYRNENNELKIAVCEKV